MPPYPLFVRLEQARVVVIGAGQVAMRKIDTLLEYGADVCVVAPDVLPEIRELAEHGRLTLDVRSYQPGDLEGSMLAIAATSSKETNQRVYEEAHGRSMLINVVDVPDLCNCVVPSIMRRGHLQIAVSTNGAAPGVARELRHELEEQFPAWWEAYIDLLADVRLLVKERVPGDASMRAPLFEALGCEELRDQVAAGITLDAESVYDRYVTPLLGGEQR